MLKFFAVIFTLAMMANVSKADSQFNKNSVKFASSLYQKVAANNENKNIIFSPHSIHTVLGLVYLGAEGQTAQEMVDGLQLTTPDKSVHSELFKESLAIHEDNPSVTFANKVYVKTGLEILESFDVIAKDKFKSEIENINFSEKRESAEMINNWVENKTNHKIKEFISPNDIDETTQMVLVNTIHFKSDWMNKFQNHSKAKFWSSLSDSTDVDMMFTSPKSFKGIHSDSLKATAVRMPFKFMELSMLIILPDERDGLSHLEADLTNDVILDLYTSIGNDLIFNVIKMPKFKIESSFDLGDTLEDLGMTTMFSNDADFSGFLKSKSKLKISKVLHKAVIDANENGVEAAAATEVMFLLGSSPSRKPIREFIVDHPFFFAIMDENGILFAGRVINP